MHKRERKKKLIKTLQNNAKLREENEKTQVSNNEHISAKTLWGRVVIYLREHNQLILHIICGDLKDVSYEDGVLVVWTEQQSTIDLLCEKNNYQELKKAFESFGVSNFDVRLNKKVQEIETNVKILKKYFENVNVIKENKENE